MTAPSFRLSDAQAARWAAQRQAGMVCYVVTVWVLQFGALVVALNVALDLAVGTFDAARRPGLVTTAAVGGLGMGLAMWTLSQRLYAGWERGAPRSTDVGGR